MARLRCGDLPQVWNQSRYVFQKYEGLMPSEMRRLRDLEDENNRLKRIVADLILNRKMLQDVIKRKL